MKIVFDNIIFSLQKYGGISVVWYELIKRVLQDLDFDPMFLEFENQNVLGKDLQILSKCFVQNDLSRLPLKIQRYLNPKVDSSEGIFHSTYLRTSTNNNLRNITTIHDFTYEYYFKGLSKHIHHLQKSNAIKNSRKIICVSQNTKDDLLKFYPDVDESNVNVVYNGVSEEYKPISIEKRQQISELIHFEIGEYLLYVGDRRGNYKNFNLLVEACRIVKCPLVILGGGKLTEFESLKLTQSLSSTKFVHLSGMSNSQLNLLYNCASFLVYPSSYEGFGIPIIEAQKAGCPVICSNKSSIPEVAGDGAIIIDDISAEKIADALIQNNSRSNTHEIVEAGFLNAQRFSWDKCYEETKKVYQSAYDF